MNENLKRVSPINVEIKERVFWMYCFLSQLENNQKELINFSSFFVLQFTFSIYSSYIIEYMIFTYSIISVNTLLVKNFYSM